MPRQVFAGTVLFMIAWGGFAVGLGGAATSPTPAPTPGLTVTLIAREFLYEPKQAVAKTGEVTFSVKNTGSVEHDFAVEDAAKKMLAQVTAFAPGKTIQVKAKLAAGNYKIYCSIPGHREAGMEATLKVVQ